MTYAAVQSRALNVVTRKGVAVTFTYSTAGTYTESTDVTTGATTATVTGSAVRVRGNPKRYDALKLIESEAPTLLVAFDTYGSLPPLNASVGFGGVTYTVRAIWPVDPDGNGAIVAKMVVAR